MSSGGRKRVGDARYSTDAVDESQRGRGGVTKVGRWIEKSWEILRNIF